MIRALILLSATVPFVATASSALEKHLQQRGADAVMHLRLLAKKFGSLHEVELPNEVECIWRLEAAYATLLTKPHIAFTEDDAGNAVLRLVIFDSVQPPVLGAEIHYIYKPNSKKPDRMRVVSLGSGWNTATVKGKTLVGQPAPRCAYVFEPKKPLDAVALPMPNE